MTRQRKRIVALLPLALLLVAVDGPPLLHAQKWVSTEDAAPLLQSILIAHRAWITPPGSIRIRGTSIRGDRRQPVTITATQKEEVVIEYGSSKRVTTPTVQFQDDGQWSTFGSTAGAFDQLDITGLFLISQLTQRQVHAGRSAGVASKEGRLTKIHLSTGRTKMHFRQVPVADEMDVFVSATGLLAAVERTMYPSDSRLRYTTGYRFSNYRDNAGVLLPYRIESVFKGNVEETILVNDYQVDAPAVPSLFQSRSQSRSAR
jgi:hypothetical protein